MLTLPCCALQLVPLIDNFELAKTQLKLESEGEKRVDAAYQGLYKQMVETFRKMGVEAVPGESWGGLGSCNRGCHVPGAPQAHKLKYCCCC